MNDAPTTQKETTIKATTYTYTLTDTDTGKVVDTYTNAEDYSWFNHGKRNVKLTATATGSVELTDRQAALLAKVDFHGKRNVKGVILFKHENRTADAMCRKGLGVKFCLAPSNSYFFALTEWGNIEITTDEPKQVAVTCQRCSAPQGYTLPQDDIHADTLCVSCDAECDDACYG